MTLGQFCLTRASTAAPVLLPALVVAPRWGGWQLLSQGSLTSCSHLLQAAGRDSQTPL